MAYAFIQEKEAVVGGGGIGQIDSGDTTSSCTAGGLLIAVIKFDFFATETITMSDVTGTNDTWTQCGGYISGSGKKLAMFRLENCASGTLNARATFVGGDVSQAAISVYEFSGLQTAGFDKTTGQYQFDPGTSADAVTSGATAALAGQPALVFGFTYKFAGTGIVPSSGTAYTSLNSVWTDAGRGEHKRVTATTAVAGTFTAGATSQEHLTFVATFLEEGGAVFTPRSTLLGVG